MSEEARRERAERILDAAAELMLRHGYKRVTMEDVARAAGVGKGTVYLHWRTKEALFRALLLRESEQMLSGLLTKLRQDSELALPWRLMRILALEVVRRPLLRALFVADSDALIGFAENEAVRRETQLELAPETRYLELLVERRVLRGDLGFEEAAYLMSVIVRGFFLAERTGEEFGPGLERRADLMADAIRLTMAAEKALGPDDTEALAAGTITVFGRTVEAVRSELSSAYA
ncbi:helix-turn-helix domain-containing protein [Kitasatospora sp. NPDC004723]|uniref:TetR/AcrR family transcriptional regulator n=1 Tax=Kitasatospora sp. NPDC004723 TaxID=3154288 RepID=UPI0033A21106